jgi:recombination protein RecT
MKKEIALSPVKQLCKTIEHMEGNFASALPPQIPSKKFIRIVLTAIQQPDLAEKINAGKVDKPSLFAACQKAAQDGLVIDGREAAIVTYWNKDKKLNDCQYMPMIAGILKKITNSGEVSTVSAHVVYQKDHFKHTLGDSESIEHTYEDVDDEGNELDRGKPIRAYAVALMKDGSIQRCVMTKTQIMAVRNVAKTKMIWDGPFADQMWEKSALRRLAKRLPSSSDLERLFESDNETYDMNPEEVFPETEPEIVSPAKKETSAARKIKGTAKKDPVKDEKDVVDAEFTETEDPPHPAENAEKQQGDLI